MNARVGFACLQFRGRLAVLSRSLDFQEIRAWLCLPPSMASHLALEAAWRIRGRPASPQGFGSQCRKIPFSAQAA